MNDPQDLAAALARELNAAASNGISISREIVDFRFASSTAFRVQVDISDSQVRYTLQSAAWALRGDLVGTTTPSAPTTGVETVSIYLLNVKVGEFQASFTTGFESQTASVEIVGQVNGRLFSYTGNIAAWANSTAAASLPEEAASVAASAGS